LKEQKQVAKTAKREVAQVGRFGIVGIINTLIDFIILNMISRATGWSDEIANIPAVMVAMTFSFFANRHFVFNAGEKKDIGRQALEFFPITAFGLIVIQGAVIYFFENIWRYPVELGLAFADWANIIGTAGIDAQFVETNGVKIVATAASLVWNYLMYKKVVFKTEVSK
jgi:putative flippase GtrA